MKFQCIVARSRMQIATIANAGIDPVTSVLLGSYAMESVEFQFAVLPNRISLVSNLLLLGLLLSPSG